MTPGHVLLATLAGLGALAAARQQVRDARAAAWTERVAEALPEADLLEDRHDGVRLRFEGTELRARLEARIAPFGSGATVLEVRVPAPLPPGLQVRPRRAALLSKDEPVRTGVPMLDADWHVQGGDPTWVGAALGAPEVLRGLRWASQHLGSVSVAGGVVRVLVGWPMAPENLVPVAIRVSDLGRAMAEASVSRWAEAGRERGLRLRVAGALAMRLESEDGRVGLRFATRRVDVVGTQVLHVRIDGFPEDVRLSARSPGDPPGRPLGDLILDRGLRARGGPPDLGARLGVDTLRGPLLDFLHGPGSPRLADGALLLRVGGGGRPVLLRRLAGVQALARALEAAWR